MILEKFFKQPGEVQDYDIDYNEYLTAMGGDTITAVTVAADPGIVVDNYTFSGGVVKIFLSGGTDGERYNVTARVTTAGGRVREGEIQIKVKEY